MKNKILSLTMTLIAAVIFSALSCQPEQENERNIIAFYNLENLFDTIDAPDVRDEEFLPGSEKEWDTGRYRRKVENMSIVINTIGKAEGLGAPAVVGLCEMENRAVIEDLVATKWLREFNYEIVHKNSPDERGIDVALIYQPDKFRLDSYKAVPLMIYDEDGERILTRDHLLVSGDLDGERFHFIVNHWPSRYGGRERTIPFRNEAGRTSRSIIDSIRNAEPDARIVLMGDLNDDPVDPSVKDFLMAGLTPQSPESDSLFNATAPMFLNGKGTLCYRGIWNMFDQMVVTPNLLNEEAGSYQLEKTGVLDDEFMRQQEGDYSGYPYRTFVGDWYHGGYSDHFPSYIVLRK